MNASLGIEDLSNVVVDNEFNTFVRTPQIDCQNENESSTQNARKGGFSPFVINTW